MFIFAFLVFSIISADVIIQEADKTSGIILNETIDVELKNATVEINADEGYLTAFFEVYSNEEEIKRTKVYLKAKGQQCYNGCHDIEVAEYSTSFNINNDEDFGTVSYPSEGVSSFAEIYETSDGKFASVDFDLLPKQINTIKVYQEITIPFEYYLDSLSTFSKADYEKITIKGHNLNIQFNKEYPVQKISENEWIWEYDNLNTKDENLKDVLIISKENSPESKKSFFQKIIDWFRNLF